MSTILVTGGSGVFGSYLVPILAAGGHEVRVLSRQPGKGTHPGDLATGAGLAAALVDTPLVVHAASDTRRFGRQDVVQTRNLLAAAGGVEHLLYLSIVGIDAVPYAYYRRKLECEELIAASGVPFTILRATQFHELIAMVLRILGRSPVAPLPGRVRCQPVAAREVAQHAATLITAAPAGRAADFGGPEVLTARAMAEQWRARRGRPRLIVPLPLPGAVGRAFRQGLNTCPDRAEGRQTWAEWVADQPAG